MTIFGNINRFIHPEYATEAASMQATQLHVAIRCQKLQTAQLSQSDAPPSVEIMSTAAKLCKLEMWANAQRDGCPAECRWRLLFNAAKFG